MDYAQVAAPHVGRAIGFFALFWIPVVLIIWILYLITLWRAMRAHESIADSLKRIAQRGETGGASSQP